MPYYTRGMASYMNSRGSQANSVGRDGGSCSNQSGQANVSSNAGPASGAGSASGVSGQKTAIQSANSGQCTTGVTSGTKSMSAAGGGGGGSRKQPSVNCSNSGANANSDQMNGSGQASSNATPNQDTYLDDDDGSYYSGMTNASGVYPVSQKTASGAGSTSSTRPSCAVSNNINANTVSGTYSSKVSSKASSRASAKRVSTKSRSTKSRVTSTKSQSKKKRVLRITPSCVDMDAAGAISRFDPQQQMEGMTFDDKRLTYMKNFLKLQVDRIQRMEGAIPASGKVFSKYRLDTSSEPVMAGNQCSMYKASHVDFADVPMVVMVYDHLSETVPNPFYLKVLRHLGKKHPFILQTWELFVDDSGRTMIVQEFANRNDLGTYLAKKGPQNEAQVCEWARQLYRALDFLGDMAICHRSLKPRRVLLIHKELSVRLTGFYDSIIYWNPNKEDILNFPCIPVTKKSRDAPDFQAPEVHGDPNKEEFDPVSADVWSFGAIVYFMLGQDYPFDYREDNPNLEEEIQGNVNGLPASEEAKAFLTPLLTTNSMLRLTFERIGSHPWFGMFRSKVIVSSVRAPPQQP